MITSMRFHGTKETKIKIINAAKSVSNISDDEFFYLKSLTINLLFIANLAINQS